MKNVRVEVVKNIKNVVEKNKLRWTALGRQGSGARPQQKNPEKRGGRA